MKLTLQGSDDWYTIEQAAHSGAVGMAATSYGFALTYAGRISDADVEGSAEEMLSIADAIERRANISHKRCAVSVDGDRVSFRSPRNSQRDGIVSLAEADELAAEIRAKLGGTKETT